MNRTAILEQIQKNVERLSAPDLPEYKYTVASEAIAFSRYVA